MTKFLLALLVAYIGWLIWRGPRRSPRPQAVAPRDDAAMTEARAILGLSADAGEADIRAAHRRLVAATHPDRGGSAELTRRINAARDTLLDRPTLS